VLALAAPAAAIYRFLGSLWRLSPPPCLPIDRGKPRPHGGRL